jgi:hypothetical protein
MKFLLIAGAFLTLAACPTPPESEAEATPTPAAEPAAPTPAATPAATANAGETKAKAKAKASTVDGVVEGEMTEAERAAKEAEKGLDPHQEGDKDQDNPPPTGSPAGMPDGAEPPSRVPVGGDPESGVIIEIRDDEDDANITPVSTQAELLAGSHVTFSGQVACETYQDRLIMRVTKAPGSGEVSEEDNSDYLTTKTLDAPGAFSIALPKSDEIMVLEILADANGDGNPTVGERAVVFMLTGDMSADVDRNNLSLSLAL